MDTGWIRLQRAWRSGVDTSLTTAACMAQGPRSGGSKGNERERQRDTGSARHAVQITRGQLKAGPAHHCHVSLQRQQ